MFNFKGKIAVVTGGAQGIGKCIADEFKKYGLNQYFLRAILTDTHYTKTKAHNLVKDFLNNQ